MADDYGSMQSRIADEIARSDMSAQIILEIQSAIKFYERKRFWFNESRAETFTTVSGQEYYDASDNAKIPYIIELDDMTLANGNDRFILRPQPYQTMQEWSVSTTWTGQPTDYAYYGQKIRLYTIPNEAWTITMSGVFRLATLSGSTDTNAWMVEAEDLIRSRARAMIYKNYLYDSQNAALAVADEQQALQSLELATGRRVGSGRIVPFL